MAGLSRWWRFQINFRNHRKLLVRGGNVGFVGGINLGDEYLGTPYNQLPWRDTHCRIAGPRDVEQMLEQDLESCRLMTASDYERQALHFRLTCRAARLLAPIL